AKVPAARPRGIDFKQGQKPNVAVIPAQAGIHVALARAYGFRVAVALLLPRSTSAVRLKGQGGLNVWCSNATGTRPARLGITPLSKLDNYRRNCVPPQAIHTIAALVILREKVLRPILAGMGKPRMGRKPKTWSPIDEHYEAIRQGMFTLMEGLRIAA
ncbi:MAG: hypothetical protein ACREV1_11380, partial [Gammaproteobacteria bacterium]